VAESIIILNQSLSKNSFLNFQLGINSLEDLYIGKQSYIENLKKIFEESHSNKFILVNSSISTFSELRDLLSSKLNNQNFFNPEDEIIYYDLNLYPKNESTLQNIFKKIKYSKDLCLFYHSTNNYQKEYLPIFKLNASYLFDQMHSPSSIYGFPKSLEIDLSEQFLNLDDTSSVLQLFSSNFDLRYFNNLQTQENFFVKSSSNKEKMLAEYNFLSSIPKNLKPYFPQVGDYNEKDKIAEYEIEKIYMLDLSKHLINRVFRSHSLETFFSKLKIYFSQIPVCKVSKTDYQNSLKKDFIQKNEQRFHQLKTLEIYPTINFIAQINGFDSAEIFFQTIQKDILDHINTCQENVLHYSHGDMCFSNILFDKNTCSIKFIDPKGYHSIENETYRSIYYDLSKLSHSCLGFYDLIVNDLISINLEGKSKLNINYSLDDKYLKTISEHFENFIRNLGYDLSVIRLYEASLFLSMIPLHQDGEKKMLAQFVQALKSYKDTKNYSKQSKILG
jgi:hypothetical protein